MNRQIKNYSFQNEYGNYELIHYLNLDKKDSLEILSLRNHELVRIQMNNSDIITKSEHFYFIQNLVTSTNGYWAFKSNGKILGSISLTNFNPQESSFVAGNFIHPSKIGTGLGLALNFFMHSLAFDKLNCSKIEAHIKKDNQPALKASVFFGAQNSHTKTENNSEYKYFDFFNSIWNNKIKTKTSKLLKYVD